MSNTLERHQGAIEFTKFQQSPNGSSYFVTEFELEYADDNWDAIIETTRSFYNLDDNWDGDHSAAPNVKLVDMAILLAAQLKTFCHPSPLRAVAGVNGTISFEFGGEPFTEIEIISESEAEYYEAGKLIGILRTAVNL